MKKLIFLLFASLVFLTACGDLDDTTTKEPTEKETEVNEVDTPEEETTKEPDEEEIEKGEEEIEIEEETNGEIELSERLMFGEFTVDFKSLIIDNDVAEIYFTWINQAGEGTKQLMNLTLMAVEQDGQELEEINDAWTDFQSDVFRQNAEGGEGIVKLQYKLIGDSPITVRFQPLNEFDEESQEIVIELK